MTDNQETLPPPALDGSPAFELDHNDPWPMPESQPVAPMTIREIVLSWIERRLIS